MNILDDFEKNTEIEGRISVLKMGAMHLGSDFKISNAFSGNDLWGQLVSFYKRKDMAEEAMEAIKWWGSLSPEEQRKYDR